MFFKRGEQPEEFPRVRIEDTPLEGYRYANWDPYILLEDITAASIAAGAESKHLWVSSERLQMTAAYTWLASARQSIGNTLVGQTEQKGRIPSDAAKVAEANYVAAQDWLEARELIGDDESFTLDDPAFTTGIDWPQPGKEPISTELFEATKKATDDLVAFNLPAVLTATEPGMFFPPEFTQYNERVVKELETIKKRLHVVERLWGGRLNPNIKPGSDIYKDLTRIIDDVVAFGVHALAPMTGDLMFRVAPQEITRTDLPIFRPLAELELPAPAEPELPAFDPAAPTEEEVVTHEEVTIPPMPDLPVFDPTEGALAEPQLQPFNPGAEVVEAEPALSFFDPAAEAVHQQPTPAAEEATPALAFFDPTAETEPAAPAEAAEPSLAFFDPAAELTQENDDAEDESQQQLRFFNPNPED